MTRAERKQQGPGMGEGRFQRSNHRRLLEAWPHLGPGPSTRRAAQSLLPRRVPGSGAPHNPSQGCEVRTAHSAGGLCPAFFRIFVVVVVGGSVGWGAGKRGSPHEELPGARRSPGRGGRLGFAPARRGRPATSPRATPSGAAQRAGALGGGPRAGLRPLPGRCRLRAPRLRQAASLAAGAGSPRAREDPARAARAAAPTPPAPGLTRLLVHVGGKLRRERPGPA